MQHIDVFYDSPIAILCEDWSQVRQAVMNDREEGLDWLDRRLEREPNYLHRLRGLHRIVDANSAALALLGVADLAELGEKVGQLLPADPSGNVVRAIARGERMCRGERDLPNARGGFTPILWQTRLPERDDEFDRVYFFAVDVSEQKQAEMANREAQAALAHAGRLSLVGELVASMTHEVSQPVSSITMLADTTSRWLAMEPANVEQARASIERISGSARHAAAIIRRIRDFSSSKTIEYASENLKTLLDGAVQILEHEARRLGVEVAVSLPPGLPSVRVDPIQIKQVVVNLVVNALQAVSERDGTGASPFVHLTADRAGDLVRITIADNGPGIEEPARLFQPFYSTKSEGLGLGLSICRRIVEEHGGTLEVSGGSSGATAVFTLRTV